jgi:hypothetical protein
MQVQKTTLLRQWWDAGDKEESAIKRAAFKCWAVAKAVVTVATGLGAAYHLYDWWRCRDEGYEPLASFHPKIADATEDQRISEALAAEDLRRAKTGEVYEPSLSPELQQHLRAADEVFDEIDATRLKSVLHAKDDWDMDASLEDFFARSDALLEQTKALHEDVQTLIDQNKGA